MPGDLAAWGGEGIPWDSLNPPRAASLTPAVPSSNRLGHRGTAASPRIAPKIALPIRVGRVRGRKPLGNRKARAIGFERLGKIALRNQNVADTVIGNRKIALVFGPLRSVSCCPESLGSLAQMPCRPPNVAEIDPAGSRRSSSSRAALAAG